MIFYWSLSDSKSPQVSRTLLSILADLNVTWMVPTRPLISKPSSPSANPLVTVPSASITIGITVTFMLHSFFVSWARSRYLSLFSFIIIVFVVVIVFLLILLSSYLIFLFSFLCFCLYFTHLFYVILIYIEDNFILFYFIIFF